ncbi:glycosyltransferase [Limnospira fusiformis]|uniref:glycosyltransferase n=1 Tax=Limnospira fusiformis TaxID=54297 RepID=UPI002AA1BC0E|nr:glycosyltransferase [Limnospira fusiformis LS22]
MDTASEGQSPTLIITGMHRSGTSLTASLLQQYGVNIGQNLVGSNYGNIKGHFENVDFVEFHKEILRDNGIDELGCVAEDKISVTPTQRQQAQQLIAQNQDPLSPWGWKDPRTTLLLDFWAELIPEAKFIFVYRTPWEVVDSLYRRSTDEALITSPEMAVKMWIFYNRQILNFYQNNPQRCLIANVYKVGKYSMDFVKALNHKFDLWLRIDDKSHNFDDKLLTNNIIKSKKPGLIGAYFPEALTLYQELEEAAKNLGSGLNHFEREAVQQQPSPSWAFKDWSTIRKLEKECGILEADVKLWQDHFHDAVDRLVSKETELGRTQLKLNGLEIKQQDAIAKLVTTEEQLGKTQGELEATTLELRGMTAHAHNLEVGLQEATTKLVATEKELGRTQGELQNIPEKYQDFDIKYQDVLSKLINTETELGITDFKLHNAHLKISSLETELGQTQFRLQTSQVQFKQAFAKLRELEEELGQTQMARNLAEGELAAIKSSKLWKIRTKYATAKRQARRALKPRFVSSIDNPTNWELLGCLDTYMQIQGWCLHTGKLNLEEVRARINEQIFEGTYNIERLDVGNIYDYIPGSSHCGFRVQIPLIPGNHRVQLEVKDTRGKWHQFGEYPLRVSPLQAAFDVPNTNIAPVGETLFAGWCCHPQYQITKLFLRYGQETVECAYGLPRGDVGEIFSDWVGSSNSGWEVLINLPPGTWNISLEAQLENGETVAVDKKQPLTVKRISPINKVSGKTKQLIKLSAAIRQRAAERKQRLGRLIPMPWEIPTIIRRMSEMYDQTSQIPGEVLLPTGFEVPATIDPYDAWLKANTWTEKAADILRNRLAAVPATALPKISVVMPVYNPPIEFLQQAIASVCSQIYSHWELCIADDCSSDPEVAKTLNQLAETEPRIRLHFRSENGNISAATNSAASLATGDFILFLDNDDELTPDALAEIALYLVQHPETDILYSDDDKIDTQGKRFAPQFKPDWSPELLLSYMYMGHALVVRHSLFQELGGFRIGYEGSQDYDFALRATEKARQIGHIPLVLYHWRTAPGSTAVSGAAKPASFQAGQNAITDAITRRQSAPTVHQPQWAVKLNLGIFSHTFPHTGPSVAIIIPTKNQLKLLQACINSLGKTTYQNYQIVVIDNQSDDPQTLAYLASLSESTKCRVLKIPNPATGFSFAYINNRAAEQVEADYLLFLNNDTEILNPDWLSQMIGYGQFEGVGAVGARLIFPNDTIQHAGIIHGLHHGLAGHAFKLTHRDDFGYLAYSKVVKNYSAVTAACLLTPKALFLEMGGFNQTDFAVAYNDADYGYRLSEAGYRCVYCPDAELIHREGTSRGFGDNPKEVATFRRRYADKIDPFYSPHLSLANEWFQIQPRRYFGHNLTVKIQPKVLMCSNALEYTGAPLHQLEIALKLAGDGDIEPVIFSVTDGPLRQVYEQQGIKVIVREHPLTGVYDRQGYHQAISALAEELSLDSYDLVYANTLENFFMVAAAENVGVPCVWNVHESEPWQTYFNRFGGEIAAQALECFRFPYRVIFVADATRNQYLPLNSHHNFITIHNGLDVDRLLTQAEKWNRKSARETLDIDPGEIAILLLGTVCDRKGQQDLVKALPLLPPQWHSRIRCLIVGDRPSLYSSQLANLVNQLPESLRSRVSVVPETPETALYYRAADIFICTSRIESYPRVILEAMGFDLPIITTPVFGIPEQVRREINALFYTPNQPDELAKCLTELLENEPKRQQFAQNAKYVLDSLNRFEEMTAAYGEIFQEAYLMNPHQLSQEAPELEAAELELVATETAPETPVLPETLTIEAPQDKNYWETNPTAAIASQWVSNPIVADTIYKRMSGGQSEKYWLRWLIEDYFCQRNFDQLISLGCGIGNHEIVMAQQRFANHIDAFDFSEASLNIARQTAANVGVNINFYQDDFNTFTLDKGKKYDIAFCSGSLHHVKEIERFLGIVHGCLHPDGYFIINEYVGDNYCIYSPHQVKIINRLYKCFGEILRSGIQENFINPTIHQVFATDPSEAVRSKLILPFIEYYFNIEVYNPFGGAILHPLYPLLEHTQLLPGDPKSEALVRLLLEFEEILMEIPGGLASDFCLCVLRPKQF